MAQDIKELFENDKLSHERMPFKHEDRFLQKLEKALPEKQGLKFDWMKVAASVVVLLGLSIGGYYYFEIPITDTIDVQVANESAVKNTKTLGDISPALKKVEDYYLASINLELSQMSYTPETKELFDDYLVQLNELDGEYERLSQEMAVSGPNELTVNALIDNLKLRLNLLYRLRAQLKEFSTNTTSGDAVQQSI
ncbi:hypothetical protein [Algibacter mikhailovii]|uniref:Uncharacterized protein n=1 Tax=Algibacter mikhailovii TaxID=425498 RepID=A0A918QQJ9_9FLAO|nr:hypothetical protein [Algibacter mikhailovii]GGZ67818.1 hypothetical protein GCM10007028_00890 [Algibacter mikhailovii]